MTRRTLCRQLWTMAILPSLLAGQTSPNGADREVRWQMDINAFVSGLSAPGTTIDLARGVSSRGQKDFSKLYPAPTFGREVASLKETVATRSDADIVLQIMRIVASAHVAHNSVELPGGMAFEQRLPLTFIYLADGMAVLTATDSWKQTIGLRVVKLGSMAPEQLLAAVAPYISHENDVSLRLAAPGFLKLRPVLEQLGLIDPDGLVSVTLQAPSRNPSVFKVPFSTQREKQIHVREALGIPSPVYATRSDHQRYWYRYLEESQTAYLQYNICANDPKLPFADFVRATMADMSSRRTQRIVLDLRWNGGGDSRVIGPLRNALARRSNSLPVYVLIGPNTFSSAIMNAIEFKHDLHATLVGEPTSGAPGGYGEVKRLVLPNSKLAIRFTSKYFGVNKELQGATLNPDIAAPLTLGDVLAGRDPGLAAAIEARK